jgi:O-methyltransferase involved in polyketide biosynthesis
MEKVNRISLTEEKETLLITLYAKALDYQTKNSVLDDKTANDIIKTIDYDFSKFNRYANNNLIVVRAKQYDVWINEFLLKNKNAIVLNLGCGLDTRITRINPALSADWFDVDYPEVIQLRKSFYQNNDKYKMIESSITEPDWLKEIPNNKPAIIIAEGVLEYITDEEARRLLNRLTDHFTEGEILFDVMSSFAVKSAKKSLKNTTGAVHKWAVDDINEVEKLNHKLKRVTVLSLLQSRFVKRLPFKFRLLFGLMSLVPQFKNMLQLLRYKF